MDNKEQNKTRLESTMDEVLDEILALAKESSNKSRELLERFDRVQERLTEINLKMKG